MTRAILNFHDIEVKKSIFHKSKHPIDGDKLNIDKILISG